MTDTTAPAAEGVAANPHYLRAVAELGDRGMVTAGSAIHADNGIKLVDTGTRIDSRLYERLVQHKLREPVDAHLSVTNAVTSADLQAQARQLLDDAPLVRLLARAAGGPGERLLAPLRSVPLPPALAFKLTVMREQRPALLSHSLQVALVAVFLGLRSGVAERDCVALAAAGLLHDIGVLHMDPTWFAPHHHMGGAERAHLTAHPVTAMVMVRELRAYTPAVERAVLEHHERMDGSGYPRGIAGDAISRFGRILLVAELAASLYEKYADMPALRLWLVLRLNHQKFPADLVDLLLPLLREQKESIPPGEERSPAALASEVHRCMKDVAAAFSQWRTLSDAAAAGPADTTGPRGLLAARLQTLERMLSEAGNHPEQQSGLLQDAADAGEDDDDARQLAEMVLVGRETLWQLRNMVDVCHRRWPRLDDRATPGDAVAADWCAWTQARIGTGHAAAP